jgi:hypothetical protein
LVTFGVCLAVLLVAVLVGEAIYRWVGPYLLNEGSDQGSKGGGAFELGEQDVSEGVQALMENIGSLPVTKCLRRHQLGDWGEIDNENRRLNSLSLGDGGSLGFESAYRMEDGTVLRISTFEDCSGTLLLTDEEYQQALLSMDEEYPQKEEDGALHVRSLRDCLIRGGVPKEG